MKPIFAEGKDNTFSFIQSMAITKYCEIANIRFSIRKDHSHTAISCHVYG